MTAAHAAGDRKKEALTLLIVDDEAIVRESLGAWFAEDGHRVTAVQNAREALDVVAKQTFDIAFVDVRMPKTTGLELQRRLAQVAPDLVVIIMTAYASVDTAVEALKAGAYDYIVKPFDPEELSHLVHRVREHRALRAENIQLRESIEAAAAPSPIVGVSPVMRRIQELIKTVAMSDATVLVTGESGTGKELVARAIHAFSDRRYHPLVIVHCGALAEGVLESELFGHEKGAFTGAAYHHKGKFEQANGGTIFLDEIGDISPQVQVDLLRVLEEKTITRVGGSRAIPVDFRIVAATNRDLAAMVEAGTFREDLFYRVNVVTIEVPPLRDRREDIPPLAEHFLGRIGTSMSRQGLRFTPEALAALEAHDWPGNARELQNAIERAVVLSPSATIGADALPRRLAGRPRPGSDALVEVERVHIQEVLTRHDWNVTRAAKALEIDRGTLYHKIGKYGLERPARDA
jgi:DNA-binding NtrC family response regulator